MAVPVGQSLYCWGGFSYSAPYCYRDDYRLFRKGRAWAWENLLPLPFPLASAGICAVGLKIYVFGGTDYDSERFFTEADREGRNRRMGTRLMALDIRHLSEGWQTLPECPGTPRWVHAMAAVGGKLYIIGEATAEPYSTVVDNWMFDPAARAWSRLRDLPVARGSCPQGLSPTKTAIFSWWAAISIPAWRTRAAHFPRPAASLPERTGKASIPTMSSSTTRRPTSSGPRTRCPSTTTCRWRL
ncbi:MAG: hypothetical protein IT210_09755 [Armatimonadetes bacterium]|nr:hypothetical protein [Armatimonadota bacterium]